MRILDRYILRSIFWPILFCIYTLIFLFLVTDIFDNLTEILRNHTPPFTVLRYYCLLIPFAFSQTLPWAVFLGMVYIFSFFTKHHELIAMKAAGLNMFSITKPLLFLGFCLSVTTFIINDRIVPPTFNLADKIKKTQIQASSNASPAELQNITVIKDNKQFFAKSMDVENQELRDVRIHFLDPEFHVTKKMVVQRAVWDGQNWVFSVVQIFELGSDRKIVGEPLFLPRHLFTEGSISPQELVEAGREAPIKSRHELRELIGLLRENGLPFTEELVSWHDKFAASWMSLVIILILIPLLGRSLMRKGMALRVLQCLLLVFCYHVIYAVVLALGRSATIPPLVSVWASHVAFACAGILLLKRANY